MCISRAAGRTSHHAAGSLDLYLQNRSEGTCQPCHGHTWEQLKCFLPPTSLWLQFGHLFAKGDTREAAIRAMVVALKQVKIRGEIRTIVDYTTEMIQHEAFAGNQHHTGWLDSRIAAHVSMHSQPDSFNLPGTQFVAYSLWSASTMPFNSLYSHRGFKQPSISCLSEVLHLRCAQLVLFVCEYR